MKGFRDSLFFPITLLVAGTAAFFLYLFVIGHDPDERPLTMSQWVIGGMLIGPGFGYLIQWRRVRDSRRGKLD
jgi:hypothetical protein